MKVLHVIESLALGGAEKVVVDLISSMPTTVSSVVCCLHESGVMAGHLPMGTLVIELSSAKGNDFTLPGKISKIIKDHHIDIVHAHNWNTFIETLLGAQLIRSIPVVHTIHGPCAVYPPGVASLLKKKLRNTIERFLVKRSCCVCTVSEAIRDYVSPHLRLSPEKVEVVINGVDTTQAFKPKDLMRQELGLEKDDIVLCFVGRLAKIKNLKYFLQVLLGLVNELPNIKVLFVGDGPERKSLEAFVDKTGLCQVVSFLGFQTNTADYLNCSDIFVLPSLYEGISVAMLEAMSAGLPIVATDVGGNSQLVVPATTGYLVPLNDADSFLETLVSLSKDTEMRNRMSAAARNRVVSLFSLERTVNRYLEIYQECLDGKTQ